MKLLFVLLVFIMTAVPAWADDTQDFTIDGANVEYFEQDTDLKAQASKLEFARCIVHAHNRFGFIIGTFVSNKPSFGVCTRGFVMCRNFLFRTGNRDGFCRERRIFP